MAILDETKRQQAIQSISKATVIGAGAMGSGIAAHLANAGVDVYLIDIVPKDADDRNVLGNNAIQRMLKATPDKDPLNAGFMDSDNAKRIIVGNLEDDLETAVLHADWIVEAIVENIDIKRELFSKIETILDNAGHTKTIVSSNTSTIPLTDLTEGRAENFKRRFAVTHFFNPPRFMRLLELVTGELTDPEVDDILAEFCDERLGKNVVRCKDTPAFIANRVGIYFMFRTIAETVKRGTKIEEADAILGRPMGFPKSGIFGMMDLVGIGIIPHITQSMLSILPEDDAFRKIDETYRQEGLDRVDAMLKEGHWGRNSPKGGFYRMLKTEDGRKQKQAIDLKTGEYYDVIPPKLISVKAAKKDGPRAAFLSGGPLADFAWEVIRDTLLYAAHSVPEISDDILDVDSAMGDAFNAKWGPFELIDQIGIEWFKERVLADGLELPETLKIAGSRSFYSEQNGEKVRLMFDFKNGTAEYCPLPTRDCVLRLSSIKRKSKPLVTHYSASVWDIGGGVACLEFHSKMNTLDSSVLWVLNETLKIIYSKNSPIKALVIYNEDKNFSLGANLGLVEALLGGARFPLVGSLVNTGVMGLVDALVNHGQQIFRAMRNAPIPVVGAPNGMALGGGCEILLHCDALQASSETYMGLVEAGVGLIPGWGGCARYLERALDAVNQVGPVPPVRLAFETIAMPQFSVSTSAQDGRKKCWLGPDDGITMNIDHLLADAKAKALSMIEGYQPPEPPVYRLPGRSGKASLAMAVDDFYVKGDATYHDVVVADALADTLTGGSTHMGVELTDEDILHLEWENFRSLLATPQTRKRIAHTLKTGKPLREEVLKEEKSLAEIRATRKACALSRRKLSDGPLEGSDAFSLKFMAEMTATILKVVLG